MAGDQPKTDKDNSAMKNLKMTDCPMGLPTVLFEDQRKRNHLLATVINEWAKKKEGLC
jgi:hypothetical protein